MGAADGSGVLVAGVLWVALAAAVTEEPPVHTLAEVLFCQPAMPSLGLALAFDDDQLFWFDFPGSRWTPRLPDLPPWPPALETPAELLRDATLCQDLRRALTALATGVLPESKGIPVANILPMRPLALGEPNTLVCMVENIFPPAVEISWQLDGDPITQGVTHTHYTPTADLAFVRFSYLPVTPAAGDIYACIVTREGDNTSVITYWVPQHSVPSEVLETALCGAAMALGILLALLGIAMILVARRSTHGTARTPRPAPLGAGVKMAAGCGGGGGGE
ncbi:class II histocompatibility antigen, M alpha chain-like [Theristicus caerulescens]